MKTLTQDNSNKLSITTSVYNIEYHAKMFFGWKSSTKRYNSIIDRVYSLGSADYDKFIKYMYELGY